MTVRTLPGLALSAFWNIGEDGWKALMDTNIRTLSAIANGAVKSHTTVLPGTPTLGDVYVVRSDDGSNPNKIAIWDGELGSEAWVYLTQRTGMRVYVIDKGANYQWSGVAWVLMPAAGPSVSDEGSQVLSAASDMNFVGELVSVTDDADGTVTVTLTKGVSVSDEGVEVIPVASDMDFVGELVIVTDDTDGTVTVSVGKGVSVSEDGVEVIPVASDMNFTGAVNVTDDADGTVTVEVAAGTGVSDEGSSILGYVTDINFTGDMITVTDDGDGSVTVDVDLGDLTSAVIIKGGWDASVGSFPGGGTALIGWSYQVTVAGTVDGVNFSINDRIIAIVDNASTTVYAANWLHADYSDVVPEAPINGTSYGRKGAAWASVLATAVEVETVLDAYYGDTIWRTHLTDAEVVLAVDTDLGTTSWKTSDYDFSIRFGGTPAASEVMDIFEVGREVTFPADLSGSVGSVGVSPTATFAIEVKDDGTKIADISISTGGVFTFTTVGNTAKTVAVSSKLTFVSQAGVDATILDVVFTLMGTV